MEGPFFQSDLQTLKQRVSELSSKYSYSQPGMSWSGNSTATHATPDYGATPDYLKSNYNDGCLTYAAAHDTATHDPFMEQVQALVARVGALEHSMHERIMQQRYGEMMLSPLPPPPPQPKNWLPPFPFTRAAPPLGAASTDVKDLGPAYWRLNNVLSGALDYTKDRVTAIEESQRKNKLRVDDLEDSNDGLHERLDMTNTRLGDLEERKTSEAIQKMEKRIDELEDRLEKLEPQQFTPASSSTGTDTGFQEPSLGSPKAAPVLTGDTLVELSDGKQVQMKDFRSAVPSVDWTNPHGYNYYSSPPYTASCPHSHFNGSEMDMRYSIDRLHQQNDYMSEHINKLDQENARLLNAIQDMSRRMDHGLTLSHSYEYEVELPARPRAQVAASQYVSTGGVDFRDREIARQDEQLKIAHEQLKASEENVAHKDAKIAELKETAKSLKEGMMYRVEAGVELREQLAAATKRAEALEREASEQQGFIDDLRSSNRNWESNFRRLDEQARYWQSTTVDEQEYYRSVESKRAQALDLLAEKEKEVEKLKEFCEQKDLVIQKQQENISWAGQLLEQRDRELEDMQRERRRVEDGRENAVRAEGRLARLLHERDDVIAEMVRDGARRAGEHRSGDKLATLRTMLDDDDEMVERRLADGRKKAWFNFDSEKSRSRGATDLWNGRVDARQDAVRKDDEGRGHASDRADPGNYSPPPGNRRTYSPLRFEGRGDAGMGVIVEMTEQEQTPPPPLRPRASIPRSPVDADNAVKDKPSPFVWDGEAHGFVRQDSVSSTHEQPGDVSPVVEKRRRGKHSARNRRTAHRQYPELEKRSTSPYSTATTRGWDSTADQNVRSPNSRPQAMYVPVEDNYNSDRCFSPPLPAPVTARRMASEADLRSHFPGRGTNKRNHLQKHRSMMELPPRKLQAYVETENESGGELGGGV